MRTHIADAVDGYQWLDQLQDVQERNRNMTDFSHLHALEERARRIHDQLVLTKNLAQHKALSVQLAQTGQEIADEREFLNLGDYSVDELMVALAQPEYEGAVQ